MYPSLFGSSVLIYSLLLSDEFPPLSSERGACTPLVDSQLRLKELCWFPLAGHHGAGLIHPLCIPMTCSYPSIAHAKGTFLQMWSCPDTPKVSSYAPCTPFGCHLCLQCHPRPLGLTESFIAGNTQQLLAPSSCPSPCFFWFLGYPSFLQGCSLAGSPASLCCALGWLHFFMLSPHGGSPSFSLLHSVQFPFSQIPVPNPPSSQQFLCLSLGPVSPFPTCLCMHCSFCLSQDGVCEVAGAAWSQGCTGLVIWIAGVHSFAYLEILLSPWLRILLILKGEKFQGIGPVKLCKTALREHM